jgi:hypothetical protein
MYYKFVISLILIALTTACSNNLNLQVESDVPTPLTRQIPLNLGIYYNDNFRNFVFKEDSETRPDWTIDSRTSRISLFNELLPSMFKSVKPVDGTSSAGIPVDVIMEPEVLEMQVALPEETHSDMYEAWIKYGIKIYNPGGNLISQWQLTGYGKTHTELFKNKESGLSTAISMALRDIGAKLVLDFPAAPGVRNWLTTKIDCSQYNNLC